VADRELDIETSAWLEHITHRAVAFGHVQCNRRYLNRIDYPVLYPEPGQGFDRAEIEADLARLGGLLRAETYACKLPFMPGMVEDMNTKRMKQGCLPEGETRQ